MADATYDIRMRETGAEAVSRGFGKADNAAKRMAKSFATAAAGMLAAGGLIAGFKAAVRAAGEQERAENQLARAYGKNTEALRRQAAELQKVTTYGDEVTIAAQARIAAFVKDEKQIMRLTEATQDLAAAQGMDLLSAADLVAKSAGSATNALSRYGVQIDTTASQADKVKELADQIERLFGGAAVTNARDAVGIWEQAANAWGDVLETIGNQQAVKDAGTAATAIANLTSAFLGLIGSAAMWGGPQAEALFVGPPRPENFEKAAAAVTEHVEAMEGGMSTIEDWGNALARVERIDTSLAEEKNTKIRGLQDEDFQYQANIVTLEKYITLKEMQAQAERATIAFLSETPGKLASINAAFKGNAQLTKRLAQSQAIIDTYAAANAAYKAMAGIPIVGPTLAAAAAALAIAQGLGNVAIIERQRFRQGGSFETTGPATISTGTGRYLVGDNPGGRERISVTPTSSRGRAQGGNTITLQFMGPITDEGFVRDVLVPAVERAARSA